MNNNEKRKMVHAMLTSFAKINTYYKRNFDTDKNNNKIIIKNESVIESVVNTEPPKIPMTNAERQRIWYANNKLKEDYKKARKKIENTDERKARRYVRELNQGRKSIDDITRNTIAKYQISFVNGTYISGIL